MNNIFKYKIDESTNFIKVGFPITSLNKIISELDKKQVNYILVDGEITLKNKNINNKYNEYLDKKYNYEILFNRINKINKILKNKVINNCYELLELIYKSNARILYKNKFRKNF